MHGRGEVRAIVIDRSDLRRLFVATTRCGVLRSDEFGQTWREVNDGIVYKHMWSLVQHPTTGELVAGSEPAVLFKSADCGESWTFCEGIRDLNETIDWTFPHAPYVAHIKGIGLCAQDPQRIIGAVEEGWLVRSVDGGQTWRNLKSGVALDAHTATYMPDNSEVVLATTGDGLFRSEDGGDHFAAVGEGLGHRYLSPQALHPSRPNVLFVVGAADEPPTWQGPRGADSGFYRSQDQGRSWQRLTNGLPDVVRAGCRTLAADPTNPDTFVAGLTDGTVWMTEDSGERFRPVLENLGSRVLAVSVTRS